MVQLNNFFSDCGKQSRCVNYCAFSTCGYDFVAMFSVLIDIPICPGKLNITVNTVELLVPVLYILSRVFLLQKHFNFGT